MTRHGHQTFTATRFQTWKRAGMVSLRRLYLQSSSLKAAGVKFTNGETLGVKLKTRKAKGKRAQYRCDGFYPIEAHNVMHAGLLFALQMARRLHGPKARCVKLDLRGQLEPERATFDAMIGVPSNEAACRFTVLIQSLRMGESEAQSKR